MRSQRSERKDIQPYDIQAKKAEKEMKKLYSMLEAIRLLEEERQLKADIRKECE